MPRKKTSQENKEEGSARQGEKAGEEASEEASEEGEVRPEAGAQESIQEEDRNETPRGKATSVELTGLPAQGARLLHGRASGDIQGISSRSGIDLKASRNFWKKGRLSKRKLSPE